MNDRLGTFLAENIYAPESNIMPRQTRVAK